MTNRLFLLRHAKAEAGAGTEDSDRALSDRGRQDAAALADYLARQGYLPDHILCSTALRCRQTVLALLGRMTPPVTYMDALYLAAPGQIVALVQAAADAAVMVVGHNPGLEQCAALLAREPVRRKEQHRHEAMEERFPTAALAVVDFDIAGWSKLSPCSGKLVDFVCPRDL